MDKVQDKILNLQLVEGKLKEYPSRLLSCLKFSMEFDKDFAKDAVHQRRREVAEMKRNLEALLRQYQDNKATLEMATRLCVGNSEYFDNLMRTHGITEDEVEELMGDDCRSCGPEENSDMTGSVFSQAGDDLPHDDEDEVSYELRKDNLKGFQRLTNNKNP